MVPPLPSHHLGPWLLNLARRLRWASGPLGSNSNPVEINPSPKPRFDHGLRRVLPLISTRLACSATRPRSNPDSPAVSALLGSPVAPGVIGNQTGPGQIRIEEIGTGYEICGNPVGPVEDRGHSRCGVSGSALVAPGLVALEP